MVALVTLIFNKKNVFHAFLVMCAEAIEQKYHLVKKTK